MVLDISCNRVKDVSMNIKDDIQEKPSVGGIVGLKFQGFFQTSKRGLNQ